MYFSVELSFEKGGNDCAFNLVACNIVIRTKVIIAKHDIIVFIGFYTLIDLNINYTAVACQSNIRHLSASFIQSSVNRTRISTGVPDAITCTRTMPETTPVVP